MKKLIALSVLAVGAHGAMYAEADWGSVADAAVVVVQDKELQEQTKKSMQHIIEAVSDCVSLAMRKIIEKSNEEDKEALKEVAEQFERLLALYQESFEEWDENRMDSKTQQEFIEIAQQLLVRCMPLKVLLSEQDSLQQIEGTLAKSMRIEFFAGVQRMVERLKNDLHE